MLLLLVAAALPTMVSGEGERDAGDAADVKLSRLSKSLPSAARSRIISRCLSLRGFMWQIIKC